MFGSLKFSFSIYFVLNLPVLLLLLVIKFALTPTMVKEEFVKSGMYPLMAVEAQKQLDAFGGNSPAFALIGPLIKQQITSTLMEKKTEKFIDDTSAWMWGQTDTVPILSFNEVKTAVALKNKNILSQLGSLTQSPAQQYASEFEGTGINPVAIPSTIDFGSLFSNDFTFPIGNQLKFAKAFYQGYVITFWVFAISTPVSLLFLWFLCKNTQSKYKWVGYTLLASAIIGVFSAVSTILFAPSIKTSITQNSSGLLAVFLFMLERVIFIVLYKYNILQIVTSAVCMLISVVFLVLAYKSKPQQPVVPPAELIAQINPELVSSPAPRASSEV